MDALISLRKLVMTQGENFRLTVDSLDFQKRQIYVLTGKNGAGKTTFLRTLALLHASHSGMLLYAGQPVPVDGRGALTYRRKVTLVDQSPFLLRGSVARNLAFGLQVRGIRGPEQAQRIQSALERVGLDGFARRKADELSGGEVKRVALARALVLQPEVLLLDEPTANIDRDSLATIENLIGKLAGQGISVIMSTHDFSQPERLSDKVLLLENGGLLEQTTGVRHQPG